MHTEFWCGSLKEEDHLQYPGVDGRIILHERQSTCNVIVRRVRVTIVTYSGLVFVSSIV